MVNHRAVGLLFLGLLGGTPACGTTTENPPEVQQANVMQAGTVFLAPGAQPTPYMIVNHMIAAGVIGRMTGIGWSYAASLPDIRHSRRRTSWPPSSCGCS